MFKSIFTCSKSVFTFYNTYIYNAHLTSYYYVCKLLPMRFTCNIFTGYMIVLLKYR